MKNLFIKIKDWLISIIGLDNTKWLPKRGEMYCYIPRNYKSVNLYDAGYMAMGMSIAEKDRTKGDAKFLIYFPSFEYRKRFLKRSQCLNAHERTAR